MITIHKIEPPENKTILEKYPRLNNIWEDLTMQTRALKSYIDFDPKIKTGEIFLIKNNNEVIGVTGWFTDDKMLDTIRMRWHGIIKSERQKGFSTSAMNLLIEHIKRTVSKNYKYLSESYTKNTKHAGQIRTAFEKAGFNEEFEDSSYGTNGAGETISIRMKIQ